MVVDLYNRLARFFDRWGDKKEIEINRQQAELDARFDLFAEIIGCQDKNPQNLYRFM